MKIVELILIINDKIHVCPIKMKLFLKLLLKINVSVLVKHC